MLELQLLVLACVLLSASSKTFLVSTNYLAKRDGRNLSNHPKTGKGKIEQMEFKEQHIENENNNHVVKLEQTEGSNAQNIKVDKKQAKNSTTCATLQVMKDCNAR